MPLVYRRKSGTRARFHKTKDCPYLAQRHLNGDREVEEIELDAVPRALPCRGCYPDAPRAESLHRRCSTCRQKTAWPCPHNGGVRVVVTKVKRTSNMIEQAGEVQERHYYVWPEQVRHHTPA